MLYRCTCFAVDNSKIGQKKEDSSHHNNPFLAFDECDLFSANISTAYCTDGGSRLRTLISDFFEFLLARYVQLRSSEVLNNFEEFSADEVQVVKILPSAAFVLLFKDI